MTLRWRWGIVSVGKISDDFVNAFNSYPEKGDQVIAGVAARDASRAREFAKLFNIGKVFDSYQDMAASSDIGKDGCEGIHISPYLDTDYYLGIYTYLDRVDRRIYCT